MENVTAPGTLTVLFYDDRDRALHGIPATVRNHLQQGMLAVPLSAMHRPDPAYLEYDQLSYRVRPGVQNLRQRLATEGSISLSVFAHGSNKLLAIGQDCLSPDKFATRLHAFVRRQSLADRVSAVTAIGCNTGAPGHGGSAYIDYLANRLGGAFGREVAVYGIRGDLVHGTPSGMQHQGRRITGPYVRLAGGGIAPLGLSSIGELLHAPGHALAGAGQAIAHARTPAAAAPRLAEPASACANRLLAQLAFWRR